jgi:signal transduction histidine kinase/ligand-binding sensor domain-containing protein/DNA-binding response OmpR family regulator
MMSGCRVFLIVFACIVAPYSDAQSLFFSNLSSRDGLPSNVITAIVQDAQQFIWVGTANGLARYDGYTFKVFKRGQANNSLPSNGITSLVTDGEFIWIGTWSGLCKINTKTFEISRIKLAEGDIVRTLHKDRNQNIWIGTAHGLVKYKDGTYKTYTTENSKLSHNTIRSIWEDREGALWIGTYDKLNRLLPGESKFIVFDLKGPYKPELKNNLICDIKPVRDDEKSLWVGTETGLCLFNTRDGSYTRYTRKNAGFSNEVIKTIYSGPEDKLWLGTDFGLNVFDPKKSSSESYFHNPLIKYSISNNVIWQIHEDAGSVIWIGTANGLSKINKDNHLFKYLEITEKINGQTIGNQVQSMLFSKTGIIWIATIHGVIRMDPTSGEKTVFNIESPPAKRILLNNVFALEEDDLGRIWIGTAGGINVWDEKNAKMYSIAANTQNGLTSNYIARFIKGADGSLWVSAFEGGLFKIVSGFDNLTSMRFEYVGEFSTEKITYALNAVWAVKNEELYRIDFDTFVTRKIKSFTHIAKGKDIYSLYFAPKGSVWAGTLNGLIEYKPSTDSTLFHPIITGSDIDFSNIISDNYGNIWAASDKFIVRYMTQSRNAELFPLEKDLPLKSFYGNCSARNDLNQIFFGGDSGFISFSSDIQTNSYQPQVIITNIEINNKAVQPNQEINKKTIIKQDVPYLSELELDYAQRSLAFNFASLHYWRPEINVFAYKLEGLEEEWKYVSGLKNFAVYSNLPAGSYKLRIRGTNNYGLWSNNEAALNIVVYPPLFLSPAFITGYIIFLFALLFIGFRLYAIRLKLKNEVKIAKLEKEHAEELVQAKQQFFTSISHELRTPISLIIPPIQQVLKRGNLDEQNKSLINLAEKNSQRLLRLINQILDFRKLEHENQALKLTWFDLVPYCLELYTLFTDKAVRNEIEFNYVPTGKKCEIWGDKEKIEIIIFNLLSNAFKFTPKKGSISLTLEIEESSKYAKGYAKISVSDSGIGIAQEEHMTVFEQFYQTSDAKNIDNGSGIGLTLVSEYTKLHRGEIKLTSLKGEGSTFTVLLPLGSDHFPLEMDGGESEVTLIVKKPVADSDDVYEFNLSSVKPLILLVEDNTDMVDFVQLSLKEKYNFVTAENGEDALNKLHHIMPDIIISDIMMPVMDGLEFCRRVKKENGTSHIPIIVLTAKSLTTHKIEGIKVGADIYITKPFEIELLEAHIDHLLERKIELAQYFRNELITQPVQNARGENEDDKFLKKVMNTIESNISNPEFSVELLSEEMGMSSVHLYRKLKSLTHLSANEIIKKYRIKKASILLKNKVGNISEIMYEIGFSNLSYFSKCFRNEFGVTPKEYQRKESKHSYDIGESVKH